MASSSVLRRGLASLQIRRRSVLFYGGALELTEDALRFVPNWANFGLGQLVTIPLEEIMAVDPVRPLLFGVLPSFWNHGILVRGRDGRFGYVIWLWRRSEWIEAIEAARRRRGSGN